MRILLSFLFILSLAPLSFSTRLDPVEDNGTGEETCTYTVLVKTGTVDGAGTDSKINMKLSGPRRGDPYVLISNLESWGGGMMSRDHDYFENGNLDTFRGTGPCLSDPVCHMHLSSDGSGRKPGWYVDFVEVLTINGNNGGKGCSFQRFDVNQWLALDEPPYRMHAKRNKCPTGGDDDQDTTINKINSDIGMRAEKCTYTVMVKTGTVGSAGTDSKISMKLSGPHREDPEIQISNLESWGGGLMSRGHDYFENGNLDTFRGTGPCLSDPICHMHLSSDGSGMKPGWYVDFVEVLTINGNNGGTGCSFQRFDVNQWLALDEAPYRMHAERNKCREDESKGPVIKLNSQV